MRHVILAAGFYGSGKTTLVCGIDRPENVLMLDYEAKGARVAEQLGILNYFSPPVEVAAAGGFAHQKIHVYQRTREIIEALPKGRFTTLIMDGIGILQEGLLAEAELNWQKYGLNQKNAMTGSMGGAWPGVSDIMNSIFNVAASRGVKVFGLTAEVKNRWGKEGPLFNKFEVKGVALIHKMSVLSLIMTKGLPKHLGAPSALVLKEALGQYEWVTGQGMRIKKRIPPKLPLATMSEVYKYLRDPADYGNLSPDEIPSPDEMAPFESVISRDQLSAMKDLLELARLGESPDGPAVET